LGRVYSNTKRSTLMIALCDDDHATGIAAAPRPRDMAPAQFQHPSISSIVHRPLIRSSDDIPPQSTPGLDTGTVWQTCMACPN
jgi:hypothetical protein